METEQFCLSQNLVRSQRNVVAEAIDQAINKTAVTKNSSGAKWAVRSHCEKVVSCVLFSIITSAQAADKL